MIKILFVCHGNICRSPMAEFVFKDIVTAQGLSRHFHIQSAATSYEELGNPVHYGTRRKLAEYGISCAGKTARRFTKADYEGYDHLLGMDAYNLSNMRRFFGSDPDGKLGLLLDYTSRPRDIADPWYTGNFEETYADVVEGCTAFLAYLKEKHPELKG